jgi:hypothetical protein
MKKTIPDLIVMSMFLIAVGLWFYGLGYWIYREHRLDQGAIPCHICGEWFPYHKPGTRPSTCLDCQKTNSKCQICWHYYLPDDNPLCPDCRTKFKLDPQPKK